MNKPTTEVTTGKVRLSYEHIMKPYAFAEGQEEKYSCTILVPKSDQKTKAAIDAAIEAAKVEGVSSKWNGVKPPIIPVPVYDGDGVRPSDGSAFGDECKGHYVFTASASVDRKPVVVNGNLVEIVDPSEVYSGMYAKVNVAFFPYNFNGKKGIGCSIRAVQKVADGDALGGGRVDVKKVFAPVEYDPITGEVAA
jgi:hypothetical protein